MKPKKSDYAFALLRIGLGLIFLWAFIDKLFGLGFATCNTETGIQVMCEAAWLAGGSPTSGFLQFGTYGPFASLYQSLAGIVIIDWLFMMGLLLIGTTLILGITMNLATYSGALMMLLMYLGLLLPEHHPFIDDHIIYAIALIALNFVNKTQVLGLGQKWQKSKCVKKHKWLE